MARSRNCKLFIEAFEIAYSLVQHVNDYEYVAEPETIRLPVHDTEEVSRVFDKRFTERTLKKRILQRQNFERPEKNLPLYRRCHTEHIAA